MVIASGCGSEGLGFDPLVSSICLIYCLFGGNGRRDRLKICSFTRCWFDSNSRYKCINISVCCLLQKGVY